MRTLKLSLWSLFLTVLFAFAAGCAAKYVTPGAGVNLNSISDQNIKDRFETKAASPFPARIVVVRIQGNAYRSYGNDSYGQGRFSVVTIRDIETDEQFERIASLPEVAGLATLNRLLIPQNLENISDLRQGAASLHADMLWLYTIETSFRVKGKSYGPLTTITLGFLPNKETIVTSTASCVLYDVRTGHVYGLSEATAKSSQQASVWSQAQAVDNVRLITEKEAFEKLIDQFEQTWDGILKEYKKS